MPLKSNESRSLSFSCGLNLIRERQRIEERLRDEVEAALRQLTTVDSNDAKCEARNRLMRSVKALNAVALMGQGDR
jgi:hypothetical protein